jgi:hypothetical protein
MLVWCEVDESLMVIVSRRLWGTPRFVAGCILWRTYRVHIVALLLDVYD